MNYVKQFSKFTEILLGNCLFLRPTFYGVNFQQINYQEPKRRRTFLHLLLESDEIFRMEDQIYFLLENGANVMLKCNFELGLNENDYNPPDVEPSSEAPVGPEDILPVHAAIKKEELNKKIFPVSF